MWSPIQGSRRNSSEPPTATLYYLRHGGLRSEHNHRDVSRLERQPRAWHHSHGKLLEVPTEQPQDGSGGRDGAGGAEDGLEVKRAHAASSYSERPECC